MDNNLEIYTGVLNYKDIDFTFVFDGTELRLIPPKEKQLEIHRKWFMQELKPGVFTYGDTPKMEEESLIGICNESGRTIIFLMKKSAGISNHNFILLVAVKGYILCKSNNHTISRMTFHNPELDCIYPITQGYTASFNNDANETGIFSVTTEDFSSTTTEKQHFQVDDVDVAVWFGISRTFNMNVGKPPITLYSTMVFEFSPTEDYSFVLRLWYIAKAFIQYLCFRRDASFHNTELSTPLENEKTRQFASMYMCGEAESSDYEILKKGRYIKLQYILGTEGNLLNAIANNSLYIQHIPENSMLAKTINAARFVMITAAFEWEFKKAFPDGIDKDEKQLYVENSAKSEIQKLIDSSSGKLKNIYKFLFKLIGSNSLQDKVICVGEHYDSIVGVFGQKLYSLNKAELLYTKMGERVAQQRNNFAHGNLDMEFIDLAALDVIYLEIIVCAMQLKHYGAEDKNIQKAINDLFGCGIYIP